MKIYPLVATSRPNYKQSSGSVNSGMTCCLDNGDKSVASYSSDNLKSNYLVPLSFTTKILPKMISFGAESDIKPDDTKKVEQIEIYTESIGFYSPATIGNGAKYTYYDDTADDLSILMGADKDVILAHQEGVSLDLLVNSLYKGIQKGKYDKSGLYKGATALLTINVSDAVTDGLPLTDIVAGLAKSDRSALSKVVFIDDMELFTNYLIAKKIPPQYYFAALHKNNPSVHFVGMVPKKMLEPKTQEQLLKGERPFDKSVLGNMQELQFDGLSAKDTKELLKKDPSLVNDILYKYYNVDLGISDKAIDSLVTQTSTKINSAFPNKALKVLDLIAASKLLDLKNKTYGDSIQIKEPDIKKFFVEHSDLIKSLDSKNDSQFQVAENVTTNFSDVGGLESLKENISDGILSYIKDPKKYLATGQKAPKGILMYGEPGTGKTLIARAVAGEANVPFIAVSGSDFVQKYVGVGAQRVRELFTMARQAAANSEQKTAIIFIDEIDAFAKKRSAEGREGFSESESTLNQLLVEMDGFNNKDSKVKVIIMAATNREDTLDPALKRPGRFDDTLEVPAPSRNESSRLEILKVHSKGKTFESAESREKVLAEAAKLTKGMTGAEIAAVMDKATKFVNKRDNNKFLTYDDVVEGYLQVMAGPIKKSELSEKDKKATVRHEGGHAVLFSTLKHSDISFITLDERGNFLGAVYHEPLKDQPNFKSVLYTIASLYAGGLAEPGFESEGHAAGVHSDLKEVTKMIDTAVTKWGLGINTPAISIADNENGMRQVYDKEIKKDYKIYSEAGMKISKLVVDFHKEFLDEYLKLYEENAGKGGNNFSGEKFNELRDQWLIDSGKIKELPALEKKIDSVVLNAQYANNKLAKLTGKRKFSY